MVLPQQMEGETPFKVMAAALCEQQQHCVARCSKTAGKIIFPKPVLPWARVAEISIPHLK